MVGFCDRAAGMGESVDVALSVVAAPDSETPPASDYVRATVAPETEYFRSSHLPDELVEAGLP